MPLAVDPVVPLVALGHGPRSAPGTAADFGVGQPPTLTENPTNPTMIEVLCVGEPFFLVGFLFGTAEAPLTRREAIPLVGFLRRVFG